MRRQEGRKARRHKAKSKKQEGKKARRKKARRRGARRQEGEEQESKKARSKKARKRGARRQEGEEQKGKKQEDENGHWVKCSSFLHGHNHWFVRGLVFFLLGEMNRNQQLLVIIYASGCGARLVGFMSAMQIFRPSSQRSMRKIVIDMMAFDSMPNDKYIN